MSLVLDGIAVRYRRRAGLFGAVTSVTALDGVSLHVAPGECLGIIGESGCGKSTLAGVIAGLVDADAGTIAIAGSAQPRRAAGRALAARRQVQLVFQDPWSSLDPSRRIAAIVGEGLAIHQPAAAAANCAAALASLDAAGLGGDFAGRYPHQLSGGQRQRVALARALAVEPQLLILDEPTSALDLSVQAQILNLLLEVQAARGLAYLLISHDIDVIRHMSHRVAVMAAGRIVETGPAAAVLANPQHDVTRRLLAAAPPLPPAVAA